MLSEAPPNFHTAVIKNFFLEKPSNTLGQIPTLIARPIIYKFIWMAGGGGTGVHLHAPCHI